MNDLDYDLKTAYKENLDLADLPRKNQMNKRLSRNFYKRSRGSQSQIVDDRGLFDTQDTSNHSTSQKQHSRGKN